MIGPGNLFSFGPLYPASCPKTSSIKDSILTVYSGNQLTFQLGPLFLQSAQKLAIERNSGMFHASNRLHEPATKECLPEMERREHTRQQLAQCVNIAGAIFQQCFSFCP